MKLAKNRLLPGWSCLATSFTSVGSRLLPITTILLMEALWQTMLVGSLSCGGHGVLAPCTLLDTILEVSIRLPHGWLYIH